ncbi:MAG: hypothetical protein A7316_08875 [Candidatus Altiarchaeales archaeon WOR_SM1_86-2]|nr:MAG: hypothetical protein A7316_08875 [Candidatus Altiarchaeales archaeon WOR_SM1_86-2]
MPCLVAHIALGWIIYLVLHMRYEGVERYRAVILLGSILPDAKVFLAAPMMFFNMNAAESIMVVMHSPLGAFLLGVFTASFFKDFKVVLALFVIGIASHFALDITMYPFGGVHHYLLLYPLSYEPIGIEAFWAVDCLTLGLVILAIIMTLLIKFFINNKRKWKIIKKYYLE